MAVIGFLVMMTFGVLCIMAAFLILYGCGLFGGKTEWPPVICALAVGGFVLYMALKHSPITVSLVQS